MYRKGLLTLILGICLATMATLQAQSVSPSSSATLTTEKCSTITDVVDREICLAEYAVHQSNDALSRTALTSSEKTHWLQILNSQLEKIQRLKKLSATDRQKMQQHFDLSEQARKAAQSR